MQTPLKKGLERLNIPDRVKRLPRDHRGFPIPWFVHVQSGTPDFRIIAPGKIDQAITLNLCWICGGTLPKRKAFVIGPMCSINRLSSEPCAHKSCAIFAAVAC